MIRLNRTGQRPLEFEGREVASASGKWMAGRERNRWHEIVVYEAGGKYVVAVEYHTQWDGESAHRDAGVFGSVDEVATYLEEYIFPNVATIGYPPTPVYGERQARLLADLEAARKTLVTEILAKLPGAAEKI